MVVCVRRMRLYEADVNCKRIGLLGWQSVKKTGAVESGFEGLLMASAFDVVL